MLMWSMWHPIPGLRIFSYIRLTRKVYVGRNIRKSRVVIKFLQYTKDSLDAISNGNLLLCPIVEFIYY